MENQFHHQNVLNMYALKTKCGIIKAKEKELRQMRTFRNKTILSVLIISMLLFTMAPPSYGKDAAKSYIELQDLNKLIEIINHIEYNYPFEIDKDELIANGLKGMLQGLDEYSDYYTKEETDKMLKELIGDYIGIGVYIRQKDNYIEVVSPMKGSPGEKAGLKSGDLIITVDGKDIKNITADKATSLIQGIEGTTVKLGILREGEAGLIYYEIVRERIEVNPIEYGILDDVIGYIKLSEFNNHADINISKALDEFNKGGIKKIILDLRNNPGGLLDQAIAVARLFVPKGPIMHARDNTGIRTYASTNPKTDYELAVLVNENSASASEIVAGAIKEREAGILIGNKTFGKGVIQAMHFLTDGSLIKLTTAEYLLPNKTPIHKIGIEPDIKIDNDKGQDLQLKKAIEVLLSSSAHSVNQ